ncbi:MAG: glycosyltransferase family 4 protein [Pseudomonadota bacterium]
MTKPMVVTLSTQAKGGITTVVQTYIDVGLYNRYDHRWIQTHDDFSAPRKTWLFFRSILLLLPLLPKKPILHLHVASHASFVRKYCYLKLGKLFGCKVILHLHGSEFREFYAQASRAVKKCVEATFDLSDRVVVLSESWKQVVEDISTNRRVVVINNFVKPVNVEKRDHDADTVTILFMGKLGNRKGTYDLLDAIRDSGESLSGYELLLCGDGELDKVKRKIREYRLQECVRVAGWIGPDKKDKYYASADVFVLPSHNEGLPMSILEAMSAQLAIITTPVGGIPEVIDSGRNGLLVDAGDVESLADALVRVCTDSELRSRLAKSAKGDFDLLYAPESVIPLLQQLYTDLMADESATGPSSH